MNLGDILGSISPAYGVASGNGLGGLLRYLNPIFDLTQLLGGHHGGGGQQQGGGQPPQMPALAPMQQNDGLLQQLLAQPNYLGNLGRSGGYGPF